MADPCVVVADQGFLSDMTHTTRSFRAADVGVVGDRTVVARGAFAYEIGVVADTAIYALSDTVVDTVVAADATLPVVHANMRVNDTITAATVAVTTRQQRWSDTLTASDVARTAREARAAESGLLTETWVPLRNANGRVAEYGLLQDAVSLGTTVRVTDAVTAHDATVPSRSVAWVDLLTVSDAVRITHATSLQVADVGVCADAAINTLHGNARVIDEVFVDDFWLLPDGGAGWTANTDAWSMSRYTGQVFNSLAVVNDVLFGAGPAGLYRCDAPDDESAPIAASIETDQLSAGSNAVKRLSMIYASGTGGAMQATVSGADLARSARGYVYPFEPRLGSAFCVTRCAPGRGLQSRYWKVNIGNVAGADFMLDTITAIFEPGSRRV